MYHSAENTVKTTISCQLYFALCHKWEWTLWFQNIPCLKVINVCRDLFWLAYRINQNFHLLKTYWTTCCCLLKIAHSIKWKYLIVCAFFHETTVYYVSSTHMWCDQAKSVGSQKYWLWDIAKQRKYFLLFPFVLETL